MKKEEFVKHITYNNIEIDVGLDDYGQSYFIEYKDETGKIVTECIGSYISEYEDYIQYRFGKPELNCPIYNKIQTSDTECCRTTNQAFCTKCRKFYNDIEYEEIRKRQQETERWLKKYYEKRNIT